MERMFPAPPGSYCVNRSAEIKNRVLHANTQRFNEPDANTDTREDVFEFQINPAQCGFGKKFKGMVGVGAVSDVIQPGIGIGFGVLHDPLLLHAVRPMAGPVDKIQRGGENLTPHRIPVRRFRFVNSITHTGGHWGVAD